MARPALDPGAPIASPLRYPGGKARVAKLFMPHIPPHDDYREIFAGGAALFFRKPLARRNRLNDLHPGLCAFYLAVRNRCDDFIALCREQTGDLRARFNYWAFQRRDLMTDPAPPGPPKFPPADRLLEQAVQYYFLNRTGWGGRVVYDPRRTSRLYFSNPGGWSNLDRKFDRLRLISARLRRVRITCGSYEPCLSRATGRTFIYADPPYYRESTGHITDKLYDKSFDLDCHRRLAEHLADCPAKVMVSYDDCPEVRALYKGWRLVTLEWKYCGRYAVTNEAKAAGLKERKVTGRELLILNYAL